MATQADYGNSGVGTGVSNVQSANTAGQNAIDSFNPTDVAGTQQKGLSGMIGTTMGQGGPTDAQSYTNLYKNAVASNPTYQSLYNTANNIYNVPAQAKQAAYLQNQVNQVIPNQYQLAKGFDVGNAQVQNAANNALMFLQPESNAATNNAQTAENLAQNYVNYGMQQNQLNLLPVQQQGQMLSSALAAYQTGFTQANQQEFQALQDKMDQGVALSSQEMQQYAQLAQAQANYQAAIDSANIKNQYQTVPGGQDLVNTFANTAINPAMLTQKTGVATYGQ